VLRWRRQRQRQRRRLHHLRRRHRRRRRYGRVIAKLARQKELLQQLVSFQAAFFVALLQEPSTVSLRLLSAEVFGHFRRIFAIRSRVPDSPEID